MPGVKALNWYESSETNRRRKSVTKNMDLLCKTQPLQWAILKEFKFDTQQN